MKQNIYRKFTAFIVLLLAVSLFAALLEPSTALAAASDQTDVQKLPEKVLLEISRSSPSSII